MTTLDQFEKKIIIKTKTLDFAVQDKDRIIARNKENELKKHLQLIQKRLDEIHELKYEFQEIMIENEKTGDEIGEWSNKFNEDLLKYDEAVGEIQEKIEVINKSSEAANQEMEKNMEERRLEKKLGMQKAEERKKEDLLLGKVNSSCNSVQAKLPKLVISKFDGSHFDWFRFWNQFETEIDKSNLPNVSKFSYLKELVIPRVRTAIDGLPFTSEGYTRAKNILESKYGKPSEVCNAHVQSIMSLPHISSSSPYKIHEFSLKLQSSVQALETMGKLREINGYVRLTIDKLQGIRADLVRTDDSWKEWKFPQLVGPRETRFLCLIQNHQIEVIVTIVDLIKLRKIRKLAFTVKSQTTAH